MWAARFSEIFQALMSFLGRAVLACVFVRRVKERLVCLFVNRQSAFF